METHTKGGHTIRRLNRTDTTLRKGHTTERKHIWRGETYGEGTYEGIYYGEGTHLEWEHR